MEVLDRDNFSLHWREDGNPNGKPVVFSNSLGTDLRIWDDVVAALSNDYRLIRYDSRGHGLSGCPDEIFEIADLADDVLALLDHVGIERCVLVGLSIGGMLAQDFAQRYPERLAGLVLSNTNTPRGDGAAWQQRINAIEVGGIESIADAVMERWFSAAFRAKPELTLWRNMLTTTPENGYLGSCHAISVADLRALPPQISAPTLVISGSEDQAIPAEASQATASMIQSARFEIIQGAGHIPCVEAPAEMARLLTEFLKEIQYV